MSLSRAKEKCLLVAIKKPTILQKTKIKNLSHIKNWRYCNKSQREEPTVSIKSKKRVFVSRNKNTYEFIKDQDGEPILYQKLRVLLQKLARRACYLYQKSKKGRTRATKDREIYYFIKNYWKWRIHLISRVNRGCVSYIKSQRGISPIKVRLKSFILNIYIFYRLLFNIYKQFFGYDIWNTFI